MSKTALIIVDFQNDFRRGGSLPAESSEDIRDPLLRLAQQVDYVVGSRDWHPPNHFSFSDNPKFEDGSWPVHCVQDTHGAEFDPELAVLYDAVVSKGMDPSLEAKQDQYSAFEGVVSAPTALLYDWLTERDIGHIIVGGLVVEHCVKATALDAVNEGFVVTVNRRAAAALSKEGEERTLSELELAGVRIET